MKQAPIIIRKADFPLTDILIEAANGEAITVYLGIVAGDEDGGSGAHHSEHGGVVVGVAVNLRPNIITVKYLRQHSVVGRSVRECHRSSLEL